MVQAMLHDLFVIDRPGIDAHAIFQAALDEAGDIQVGPVRMDIVDAQGPDIVPRFIDGIAVQGPRGYRRIQSFKLHKSIVVKGGVQQLPLYSHAAGQIQTLFFDIRILFLPV